MRAWQWHPLTCAGLWWVGASHSYTHALEERITHGCDWLWVTLGRIPHNLSRSCINNFNTVTVLWVFFYWVFFFSPSWFLAPWSLVLVCFVHSDCILDTLYQQSSNFSRRGPDSTRFRICRPKVSLAAIKCCHRSTEAATVVGRWVGLWLKKGEKSPLIMVTEIWISCSFHVTK